ncbi:MAG: ImmA/IrrE family metallo-endopeptidase [Lachnospiraceae bacterium]|nr:ImmA/IrrE family metallo-endopeptidase [Lachnospiraceae bacterium]
MTSSRKRDIRRQAGAFREKCKISRYGIIDLFKECERLDYKLIRYPLGENSDLGFTLKREDDIIIFINTSIRLSREIFTLAHEIGHVILHFNGEQPFIENNVTIAGQSEDEKEHEANYFAACLLMPSDEVDRFIDLELPDYEKNGLSGMDIARIMSEFNVSYDVALNRLASLEKIDGNQKIQLETVRSEKRVGNLLRSIGGNARLNTAGNEIVIPYEYIDYVIYNYNHNVIPRETLEKVLECYHLSMDDISDRLIESPEADDDLDDLIGGLED